ncbi:MAG: A/G-specific adenine glycosylase [Verrucomicrobia bacterium]|nr:MAG: A/G-specific adenine glycosylase [Verrucomicrobiota bacterium]
MRREEEQLLNDKNSFNKDLHDWYKRCHRKLPWRTEPGLYKTVVSEFMLQQTQVDTVLPYFHRWLEIFPDFKTLSAAQEEDVVKQWEGLGYYSRARNLHKLSKELLKLDLIPTTPEEWIKFPGVGPYTAAAITSIGFSYPAAVVDGNVIRILTRLSANELEFKDGGSAVKSLTPLANALLQELDPNTHNQAVMELGATVCTKANPLCTVCPVVQYCQASKKGIAEQLPKLMGKKIENIKVNRLWMVSENNLLLQKKPSSSKRLANMYELPEIQEDQIKFFEEKSFAIKKRGISNQRIEESIYRGNQKNKTTLNLDENMEWIAITKLHEITLSGPHRRWISEILEQDTDLKAQN